MSKTAKMSFNMLSVAKKSESTVTYCHVAKKDQPSTQILKNTYKP